MKPDNQCDMEQKFRDNFERIHASYYPGMLRFVQTYGLSREDAENVVHDAFAEVWEVRHEYLHKMNHLLAFLFATVKNRCIDYLRHQIVRREAENAMQEEFRLDRQMKFDSLEAFEEDELTSAENIEDMLRKAIDALPEKCREIFIKSKLEGKKQKEIAKELNISINTIETQMSIAYKKLKQELKNYLPLLLLLLS
jgi:RNA polymerase sigma-70 factor (ECF subfamily)